MQPYYIYSIYILYVLFCTKRIPISRFSCAFKQFFYTTFMSLPFLHWSQYFALNKVLFWHWQLRKCSFSVESEEKNREKEQVLLILCLSPFKSAQKKAITGDLYLLNYGVFLLQIVFYIPVFRQIWGLLIFASIKSA